MILREYKAWRRDECLRVVTRGFAPAHRRTMGLAFGMGLMVFLLCLYKTQTEWWPWIQGEHERLSANMSAAQAWHDVLLNIQLPALFVAMAGTIVLGPIAVLLTAFVVCKALRRYEERADDLRVTPLSQRELLACLIFPAAKHFLVVLWPLPLLFAFNLALQAAWLLPAPPSIPRSGIRIDLMVPLPALLALCIVVTSWLFWMVGQGVRAGWLWWRLNILAVILNTCFATALFVSCLALFDLFELGARWLGFEDMLPNFGADAVSVLLVLPPILWVSLWQMRRRWSLMGRELNHFADEPGAPSHWWLGHEIRSWKQRRVTVGADLEKELWSSRALAYGWAWGIVVFAGAVLLPRLTRLVGETQADPIGAYQPFSFACVGGVVVLMTMYRHTRLRPVPLLGLPGSRLRTWLVVWGLCLGPLALIMTVVEVVLLIPYRWWDVETGVVILCALLVHQFLAAGLALGLQHKPRMLPACAAFLFVMLICWVHLPPPLATSATIGQSVRQLTHSLIMVGVLPAASFLSFFFQRAHERYQSGEPTGEHTA